MVRKIIPNMIANDIIGVQPMTGPVGQIFTMRSRYTNNELGEWLNKMFGKPQPGTPDYELEKYFRKEKPQAIFN